VEVCRISEQSESTSVQYACDNSVGRSVMVISDGDDGALVIVLETASLVVVGGGVDDGAAEVADGVNEGVGVALVDAGAEDGVADDTAELVCVVNVVGATVEVATQYSCVRVETSNVPETTTALSAESCRLEKSASLRSLSAHFEGAWAAQRPSGARL